MSDSASNMKFSQIGIDKSKNQKQSASPNIAGQVSGSAQSGLDQKKQMNNAEKAMKRQEEEAEKLLQKNNNCKLNLVAHQAFFYSGDKQVGRSQAWR